MYLIKYPRIRGAVTSFQNEANILNTSMHYSQICSLRNTDIDAMMHGSLWYTVNSGFNELGYSEHSAIMNLNNASLSRYIKIFRYSEPLTFIIVNLKTKISKKKRTWIQHWKTNFLCKLVEMCLLPELR